MTRLFKIWRCAAALAVVILTGAAAFSQDPAVDLQMATGAAPVPDEYLAEPTVVDSTVVEAYGPELPHNGPPVVEGQPVNWISGPYLKLGTTMAFDGGILASQDAGYTISGGFRQPLSPALDERLFFDVGGSYLSAFGQKTRITDGTQTVANVATPIDIASTLKEVQRGGVHAALGWYWGAPIDYRSNDLQLRIATRLGGRLDHVRGRFDDAPVVDPPDNSTIAVLHEKTDTSGGVFVGTEVMILNRDFAGGSVQWTLDGEYANDWIQFDGWGSGSLGTASIMAGVMYSR